MKLVLVLVHKVLRYCAVREEKTDDNAAQRGTPLAGMMRGPFNIMGGGGQCLLCKVGRLHA